MYHHLPGIVWSTVRIVFIQRFGGRNTLDRFLSRRPGNTKYSWYRMFYNYCLIILCKQRRIKDFEYGVAGAKRPNFFVAHPVKRLPHPLTRKIVNKRVLMGPKGAQKYLGSKNWLFRVHTGSKKLLWIFHNLPEFTRLGGRRMGGSSDPILGKWPNKLTSFRRKWFLRKDFNLVIFIGHLKSSNIWKCRFELIFKVRN